MIRETRMLIYQAFFGVFPIYTGVILCVQDPLKDPIGLPHIYGGDSELTEQEYHELWSSPYIRG